MLRIIHILVTLARECRNRLLTVTGTWLFRASLQSAGGSMLGKSFRSNGHAFLRLKKNARIRIGHHFTINNGEVFNSIGRQDQCVFTVRSNAELIIGDNVGISSSAIFCNRRIVIGNNVKIGGNSCIYDTDFHSLSASSRRIKSIDRSEAISREVCIGDDVFIGAHSTILKGVSIGDRSIIGACSVVSKDVPSDEIWAGNPAKFIRAIPVQQAVLQY